MNTTALDKLSNLIQSSKTIAIVPSKMAGKDSFCAGVGLFYLLTDMGKDAYFVYPGKIPDGAENLIDQDRITSNVNERELLVTIDYSGTPAANAHYSTEGDTLQIKIGPVSKDFPASDRVSTKLTGFDFDTIIVIGSQDIEDLGNTFKNLREAYGDAKIVNIDNTERNTKFGDAYLIDEEASSLSQLVFKVGAGLNLIPGEKTAKALLTGMVANSQ